VSAPHRVILLGSGTCRLDSHRGQTSACVVLDQTTYVIDIGVGTPERLARHGAFDRCRELHIHISHSHIDHVFGLFPLLQCLAWSDDARYLAIKRVVIHASQSVCDAIRSTQSIWGERQTEISGHCDDRVVEYCPGSDTADWHYEVGSVPVHSVHLPTSFNHGVRFSVDGKSYAFTCDATELNAALIKFCSDADVCVFDLGHLSFTPAEDGSFALTLEPAARLLASANPKVAYPAHIYLRHLQNTPLSAAERADETGRIIKQLEIEARSHGFSGRLIAAEDGVELSL